MKIKACLTNKSDLWQTPKKIYEYYINLGCFDPCPVNPNFDGLNIQWQTLNFVNPPYSKIKDWVKKAIYEKNYDKTTILLIPSRTDTKWFKLLYENNAEFIFIQQRLKFSDKKAAPFPSMLVHLTPQAQSPKFMIMKKEDLKRIYDYE